MELKSSGPADVGSINPGRVKELVYAVLQQRFPGDHERQKIIPQGKRIGFCCPYCGDSATDPRKKRGNMYVNWLYFKCYNGGCDKYCDIITFLKDAGMSHILTDEERTNMKVHLVEERQNSNYEKMKNFELNLNQMVDADWERLLISRDKLMKQLGLWNINEGSPQHVYLTKRHQVVDEKFAWDNKRKRLFLFNLDRTGQWIFSLQVKPMDDPTAKYKTYNNEKVWSLFMGVKDPGLLEYAAKYNHLSTLFGILRVDLSRTVTIFEGPMDHFLYPNSVAMCGISNDWPFDLDNTRWFQDNDEAGRKKALELLEAGKIVFLWKNLFDKRPNLYGSKRKDYNDLIITGGLRKEVVGSLEEFFSSHHLDGIYI